MRRLVLVCCLASVVGTPAPIAAGAVSPKDAWPRVYIKNPRTAGAVLRALNGAARRLTDERCQAVLSDFHDEQGRPLNARLKELDQTGLTYLPLVVFLDGSSMTQCTKQDSFAYTAQGARTVFVCGQRFERVLLDNPPRAEAVIIHEALHTLGLGENPPSSLEITQQVMRRCWR